MAESSARTGRQHYGIAEIAEALGVDRQLVTVWRRRLSRGMPEPDDELAAGPLWLAATIEPWIAVTRARLEFEASHAGPVQDAALPARALRRYLRLTALLLEEPGRPGYAGRAARDLGELVPALEEAIAADKAAARRLQGVLKVARRAGDAVQSLSEGNATTSAELLRECFGVLPTLGPLGEHCLETR